jgi:hypothetical protein
MAGCLKSVALRVVDRLEHPGRSGADDVGRWVGTAERGELGVGLFDGVGVGEGLLVLGEGPVDARRDWGAVPCVCRWG